MIMFIMFLSQIIIAQAMTCDEIQSLPEGKKMTLTELQKVEPKDTVHCLAHLGKERLPKEEAEYIWQSIVAFYSGVSNVPDKVLMMLHWITPALTMEDYANITLHSIDVIMNFGLDYGLDEYLLSTIADRVREDFSSKEPKDYTCYDLVALRQILCAFNKSDIQRIHPSAFKEAAFVLGKLENCKHEVLQGFVTLAVQPSAFGPPAKWSPSVVQNLGNIAKVAQSMFIGFIKTE